MPVNILSAAIRRFVKDQRGATMVEYAMLVALIAVVAVTALTLLGPSIAAKFEQADTALNQQ